MTEDVRVECGVCGNIYWDSELQETFGLCPKCKSNHWTELNEPEDS